MTQVVTVHTDFADLNQMAQGLIGRVNETHVILPAQQPVDVGGWAQFTVTLSDGSPGLAGMGRCVTFVDNGEDRSAHQRFDVVFDSLQFDPRGQQIYTHILSLSGYEAGAEASDEADERDESDEHSEDGEASDEQNAESAYEDAAPVDVSSDFSVTSVPPRMPDADDASEATVIADRGALQAAIAAASRPGAPQETTRPPAPHDVEDIHDEQAESWFPPEPTPLVPSAGYTAQLSEARVTQSTAYAEASYTPEPLNGGSFHYDGGLPFPAEPPRPVLDPALRVSPAPRPLR